MNFGKAHFIGIAGAGMSATAKLLLDQGDHGHRFRRGHAIRRYPISCGSTESAAARPTRRKICPPMPTSIVIGKNARLVPQTNPEVAAAYASGKTIMSFPEVLGALSQGKETIVVAGAYGKSTSAALLAHCLEAPAGTAGDGFDPSFFIGAIPLTPSTNARLGAGRLFVLEGDEYPSSNTDPRSKFLHYHPRHLLITPLAHDHLNVFPTPDDYVKPFEQLVTLPPPQATIIACVEGPLSPALLSRLARPVTSYGVHAGEFHAADIAWGETTLLHAHAGRFARSPGSRRRSSASTTSRISSGSRHSCCPVDLLTPGEIAAAIASFRGIRRRLDRKSEKTTIPIFEGFGSSYDKARSAIAAMKRHFPDRRLITVFEPHTFSWRNRDAISWYDDVFDGVAKVFIYEPASQGAATHLQISQAEILDRVIKAGCDAEPFPTPTRRCTTIRDLLQPNDAVLLLTSGNLGGLIDRIPFAAEQKFPR